MFCTNSSLSVRWNDFSAVRSIGALRRDLPPVFDRVAKALQPRECGIFDSGFGESYHRSALKKKSSVFQESLRRNCFI